MTLDLAAVLIAGLAGSAHCIAMCGGIAGALGGASDRVALDSMLLSIGRLAGYALAGAIVGAFGVTLATLLAGTGAGPLLRVGFGLVLVLIGVRTLSGWRGPRWLERAGARVWARIAPAAGRLARRSGVLSRLGLGFLWGWLPCGLVYTMLAAAMTAGGPAHGALVMLVFGLGTVPAVAGMMLIAGHAGGWLRGMAWRRTAGVLLVLFGLWTAAHPLMHLIGSVAH